MNSTSFHRRNLPHYYRPNSTYFITFRIKGSIPLVKLLELNTFIKQQIIKNKFSKDTINENYFYKYDQLIHKYSLITYLDNPFLANFVKNELHKYAETEYKLLCYSIMPNHVHLIFHLLENAKSINKIMQNIKRISAYNINKYLNKSGNFWQAESYDHIVRDQYELDKLIEYTLMNPVKVGIVEDWKKFDYNYLSDSW